MEKGNVPSPRSSQEVNLSDKRVVWHGVSWIDIGRFVSAEGVCLSLASQPPEHLPQTPLKPTRASMG